MTTPRTLKEAAFAEMMGDMAQLLDRADAVTQKLPEAMRAAVDATEGAINGGVSRIQGAGESVAGKIGAEGNKILGEMQSVRASVAESADLVHGAARRMLVAVIVIAVVAGAIAGALAAFGLTRLLGV